MKSMTLSSIQFSFDSVSELDQKRKSISIAKKDIKSISLRYGIAVERPTVQAIISLILILIGLYLGVYPLSYAVLHNNLPSVRDEYPSIASVRVFAYVLPLIFIGVFLLTRLFIKRFYLLINTDNDKRKLVFNDKLNLAEVQAFIMNCNNLLEYGVELGEFTSQQEEERDIHTHKYIISKK